MKLKMKKMIKNLKCIFNNNKIFIDRNSTFFINKKKCMQTSKIKLNINYIYLNLISNLICR